jgi:peptidoglycan/LPS O-acetylase OafA/YrhL
MEPLINSSANISNQNNIGFIRLFAAISVIYGHSLTWGGFNVPWNMIYLTNNQTSEARLAVDIFFVLSGFLITKKLYRL